MLEGLIQQVQAAVKPEIITVGERDYVSRKLNLPPEEAKVKPLVTQTLQSVRDQTCKREDVSSIPDGRALVCV